MSNEIIYRLRSYIFIAFSLFLPFQVELVTHSVDMMTISTFSSVWLGFCMLSWKLMNGCLPTGTMVVQVAATDADDPTYGNSARVVYSIIHGQPYFSVEPKTGRYNTCQMKVVLILSTDMATVCHLKALKIDFLTQLFTMSDEWSYINTIVYVCNVTTMATSGSKNHIEFF